VTNLVQVVAIAVSTSLFLVVVELVRQRRLREEYAFVWLLGALALLGLAVWRNSLDLVARWLGVYYPPAVLLLAVILAVFIMLLFLSVVISKQRQQIERLVEEVALLDAAVRASGTIPSAEMVANTARDRKQTAGDADVA
jgi:hypothetical protein